VIWIAAEEFMAASEAFHDKNKTGQRMKWYVKLLWKWRRIHFPNVKNWIWLIWLVG